MKKLILLSILFIVGCDSAQSRNGPCLEIKTGRITEIAFVIAKEGARARVEEFVVDGRNVCLVNDEVALSRNCDICLGGRRCQQSLDARIGTWP